MRRFLLLGDLSALHIPVRHCKAILLSRRHDRLERRRGDMRRRKRARGLFPDGECVPMCSLCVRRSKHRCSHAAADDDDDDDDDDANYYRQSLTNYDDSFFDMMPLLMFAG